MFFRPPELARSFGPPTGRFEMPKRTIYRDSGTGRIIPKKVAEQKDPRTWEKERVDTGKKKSGR
jgi:hypothetical protein